MFFRELIAMESASDGRAAKIFDFHKPRRRDSDNKRSNVHDNPIVRGDLSDLLEFGAKEQVGTGGSWPGRGS